MAQLKDDDRRRLFAAHSKLAFFLARPFRGRGLPDEDVDQEALLGLWEATGLFDSAILPLDRFGAFAQSRIRSRLKIALRHERRIRAMEVALDVDMLPDESPPPEDPSDMADLVREALQLLPAAQRRVIELRFGLGGREPHTVLGTATAMGIPVSAVKRASDAVREVIRWMLECEGWTAEKWARNGPEIFIRVG